MSTLRAKLVRRLTEHLGLPADDGEHIAAEVLDLFGRTVHEFVADRHTELRREGVTGPAVYAQIQRDLRDWRFAAPQLSIRQIRRRIYG